MRRWCGVGWALASALGSVLAGAAAFAQGKDSSRAVIGVFSIRADGLPELDAAALDGLTGKLHQVIAVGSGFLTVPRAAIKKALEGSSRGAEQEKASVAQLASLVKQLEVELARAKVAIEGAREAAEIVPDSQEAAAMRLVWAAEEEAEETEADLEEARRAYADAKARAEAWLSGGACLDDACRAEIGRRVGASKVLRATFARIPKQRVPEAPCELELRFYDIEAGLVDLTVRSANTCDASGLSSAIDEVAAELRRRHSAGYEVYKLDLADASLIENPPSAETSTLAIEAAAKGDPNEAIEVWLNGELSGRLENGRFARRIPRGRYLLVLKPVSNLFSARRFDFDAAGAPIRVPASGVATLEPVFGSITFDLPAGPWDLRSGMTPLVQNDTNRVRPGLVPVQIFLGEDPLGELRLDVAPGETKVVAISERPLTEGELAGRRTAWAWRKWGSIVLAAAAIGVGSERLAAAHSAADERDAAVRALEETTSSAVFTETRGRALALDEDRASAQNVALGLLGAAVAVGVWSAVEWLFMEPDRGELVAPGLEILPIASAPEEQPEQPDRIETAPPPGSPR